MDFDQKITLWGQVLVTTCHWPYKTWPGGSRAALRRPDRREGTSVLDSKAGMLKDSFQIPDQDLFPRIHQLWLSGPLLGSSPEPHIPPGLPENDEQ